MFTPRLSSVFFLLVFLGVGFPQAGPALAQTGEDFLEISSGGSGYANFGTAGLPTLPADYFGPGSDPFEGQVACKPGRHLLGNPYPYKIFWQNLPVQPHEPVGTSSLVPVEITELWLGSAEPITVTYLGGSLPELWDVVLTLSVVSPPASTQNSTKTHVNGGTFSSTFHLQPSFLFTRVADGVEVEFDTGLEGVPYLVLEAPDGHWVHDPDPSLGLEALSAGQFVSCVEEGMPGDLASQCPAPLQVFEPSDAMYLDLGPGQMLPPPDPFCAVPGDEPGGSHVVFGPADNPPIPPEFFGPGSEPFEGPVPLFGEPLGPTPWGEYEDADTLIKRLSDPFDRCELPMPTELRPIDIEIVAMNLVSLEPLTVSYNGGQYTELWDLRMTPSSLENGTGNLNVFKVHDNGGTFTLDSAWYPRYVFTRVSDGYQLVMDVGDVGPELNYEAPAGHWVHSVLPNLQVLAPSDGQFVPGVEEVIPGDPGTQEIRVLELQELSGAGVLAFRPTVWGVSGVGTPAAPAASLQVVPNPFNPVTRIVFELARSGPVSLRIYDLQGKLVRTLVQSDLSAGRKEIPWHAMDDSGRRVASGVYLSVLKTDAGVQTAKMAVIK